MAIAPIDLQTLFSQVDKVGKAHAAEREGQANQQAMHGIQLQHKKEEQIQQVNEAQDAGEGTEKINDQSQRQKNAHNRNNKASEEDGEEQEEEEKSFFNLRDPSLGNKIDISY